MNSLSGKVKLEPYLEMTDADGKRTISLSHAWGSTDKHMFEQEASGQEIYMTVLELRELARLLPEYIAALDKLSKENRNE